MSHIQFNQLNNYQFQPAPDLEPHIRSIRATILISYICAGVALINCLCGAYVALFGLLPLALSVTAFISASKSAKAQKNLLLNLQNAPSLARCHPTDQQKTLGTIHSLDAPIVGARIMSNIGLACAAICLIYYPLIAFAESFARHY
ncbi:MAG: hypothetical protein Q4P78_08370 [Rothia sp. (in: high G+C Gram-positive bacteria)]|uniref:hypothetical protein n=1 Tax=Rothia sp. (in: high G+C Gram-positive bacteria) TaxID=1885016 RepID=UPI0026DFDD9B|nr:hypothetical protein [Rothia sp. (in: high G+C Gram-positive bacteria)]MDO5751189.1 hypothetical protein [Rothia sp. (in: high G+C Gram-positive bacteria)]